MLTKPDECHGCPLYGSGQGFVPDHIVPGTQVTWVCQNPGANEERGERIVGKDGTIEHVTPQPLIGKTGYDFTTRFLPLTGLSREQVSLCNLIKCRWNNSNDLPTGEMYVRAVQHCTRTHLRLPHSSRLLVAMGAHAWRFLGGPDPLSDWRGFLAPGRYQDIPVFSTVHLADLYHDPKLTLATMRDYTRIKAYLKGTWPRPLPDTIVPSDIDIDRMLWWFEQAYTAPYVAIDTEYNSETKDLYLVGMGIPGDYPTLQIRYNSCHAKTLGTWVQCFRKLIQVTPCVFHNALADVPALRGAGTWRYDPSWRNAEPLGVTWGDYRQIHDTMQAHAVLWSELPHDLEFLASIYGRHNKLKHLRHTDPLVYNQGDVLETLAIWEALEKEFENDPQSRKVYDTQMRLLPIVDESMARGISVNQERVATAYHEYAGKVAEAQSLAQAYTGWPINLGSDEQLGHWLYDIEGQKEQMARRKEKGKKTRKSRTVNEDAIAVLRGGYLECDPDEDITTPGTLDRIARGGHPLLEAKVLHTAAAHAISNYLKPLMVDDE